MTQASERIDLSLISHTNVGKTTLARTLLGRDIGDVRDAPHVTALAEPHIMIETPEGDALRLWDTPGFADSARLAKRLRLSGNPIGWFLSQVWDRWRDRPLWLSQQAVRNVRNEADAVLYLVNAAEHPADAGYVAPELEILEWIGKPVIVLLNQIGPPRERTEEDADEASWRSALMPHRLVQKVLTLDAFARCWVQEITLLRTVQEVIPEAKRESFARLRSAWQARRMQQFDEAMAVLAAQIARAACDREPLDETGWRERLRGLRETVGLSPRGDTAKDRAMAKLTMRLDADVRDTLDKLISIHGLAGHAAAEVLLRVAADFDVRTRASEGKAAVLGGLLSGAASGLAADLAAGGLTLGAGLLAGGLLGALGGAGLARAFNTVRGAAEPSIAWADEFLSSLVAAALLRYLAVAHYGRGRGEWRESEYPPFWKDALGAVLAPRRDALAAIWSERQEPCDPTALTAVLQGYLSEVALEVLEALYPAALESARSNAHA